MAVYSYGGTSADGVRRTGYIVAATPKMGRRDLEGRGIVAEELSEAKLSGQADAAWRIGFYESLGMLVKAGFPLSKALDFMSGDVEGGARGAIMSLSDSILGGATLAEAMAALAPAMPPFERAALAIADRTGAQGDLLVRLSSFMESERRMRDDIRSALAYPSAVFCFALLLLAVVTFAILPRAGALFPGEDLPSSVRTLRVAAPVAFGAIIVIAALALRARALLSRRAGEGGAAALRLERILLSLPVAKYAAPRLWASRFAGTMAMLLDAGLAPQDAIEPAGEATGSALVAAGAADAAAAVRGGASLSAALGGMRPVSRLLLAWVAVGEKTGSLAEMLHRASERAAAEYGRRLRRALSLLEPALVAAVGTIVLAVALAVIRPMLDLTLQH